MELLHITTMKKNKKRRKKKFDVHCYNGKRMKNEKRRRQLALRFRRDLVVRGRYIARRG